MTPLADYLPVTITGSESVADLPSLRNRLGPEFKVQHLFNIYRTANITETGQLVTGWQ